MEHTHGGNMLLSFITTVLSIGSFMLAHITKSDIAWFVGIGSGCVAMGSGCMAIRYYYFATKKLKQ